MGVDIDLIAIIQQLLSDHMITINTSHCSWQYSPFPSAVIQTRTEFIVFSMLQGVSLDRRVDIGKSTCSRHLPWCPGLNPHCSLKWTFSQSSLALSSYQIVDISVNKFSRHFLKCPSLLSKRELKLSFSACPKKWVEIKVSTSARVIAVDVFHGVLGWYSNLCINGPYRHHSTTSVWSHYCHQ